MLFMKEALHPALVIYGLVATGIGVVEDICGAKGIGRRQEPAVHGTQAVGNLQEKDGDGAKGIGRKIIRNLHYTKQPE